MWLWLDVVVGGVVTWLLLFLTTVACVEVLFLLIEVLLLLLLFVLLGVVDDIFSSNKSTTLFMSCFKRLSMRNKCVRISSTSLLNSKVQEPSWCDDNPMLWWEVAKKCVSLRISAGEAVKELSTILLAGHLLFVVRLWQLLDEHGSSSDKESNKGLLARRSSFVYSVVDLVKPLVHVRQGEPW